MNRQKFGSDSLHGVRAATPRRSNVEPMAEKSETRRKNCRIEAKCPRNPRHWPSERPRESRGPDARRLRTGAVLKSSQNYEVPDAAETNVGSPRIFCRCGFGTRGRRPASLTNAARSVPWHSGNQISHDLRRPRFRPLTLAGGRRGGHRRKAHG